MTEPIPNTLSLAPEAIVEQLRTLREQIPEYSQLTNINARILRSAAAASIRFIHAAINAIGASLSLQGALGTTQEAMWSQADEAARWAAVEDELRAMLQGVAAANLTRRHRLGLTALQTYSISRQLVRKEDHTDLLPHVEEMRRLNRFGRKRRDEVKPQPQPRPQA